MEAELVGKLSIHEGCVRIESIYGENSYLPIWPPDFNLEIKDDVPVVFDGSGAMVGRMDEEIFIYMGGGEVPEQFLPACIREKLPVNCSGPVWIVGEGVRPVLRHDANLFNLETFAINDGSVFLVSQNIVLDGWIDPIATIEGQLVLPESTTIPRLQSDTLDLDVLLIWPQGYSVQFSDGFVEIINPFGDIIAREGENVVLHGGLMPAPFTPEQNPELYYDLPKDFIGPYWIITQE